jgi:hypothetical protein
VTSCFADALALEWAASEVALFGIVVAGGDCEQLLDIARAQIAVGATFIDLRFDANGGETVTPETLQRFAEEFSRRYPGRLGSLGPDIGEVDGGLRPWLSFGRRRDAEMGAGWYEVIDLDDDVVVAKGTKQREFGSEASLEAHGGRGDQLPLHAEVRVSIEGVGDSGARSGVTASEVALSVIRGVSLVSVDDVLAAVKARDEIVKIRNAG